jgi:hypothetical protein
MTIVRAAAAALLLASLAALPAHAIPTFARRYKTSCTTCHTLPPQLNPVGSAFRANGYRLPSGEGRRQEDDVQLGAPEWEELFPRSFLPGTISDVAPVAGYLKGALESAPGAAGKPRNETIDLTAAILSGGNLGKRASWYASARFTSRGVSLGRTFLVVNALGPWLAARAGQMEPGLVPWSQSTQRLSYIEYLPYETRVGTALLGGSRPAFEVYGAGSDPGPLRGLAYLVGVSSRDVNGLTADGYARLSYKFGGVAPAGDRGKGQSGPSIAPLRETSLRVGGFIERATLGGPASRPRALRGGADATLLAGDLEATLGGWIGQDDALSGTPWSWLAGASLRPWPWLMLLGRYEALYAPGQPLQRRVVATARGALQQNVALSLETEVGLPDGDVAAVAAFFVAY